MVYTAVQRVNVRNLDLLTTPSQNLGVVVEESVHTQLPRGSVYDVISVAYVFLGVLQMVHPLSERFSHYDVMLLNSDLAELVTELNASPAIFVAPDTYPSTYARPSAYNSASPLGACVADASFE